MDRRIAGRQDGIHRRHLCGEPVQIVKRINFRMLMNVNTVSGLGLGDLRATIGHTGD